MIRRLAIRAGRLIVWLSRQPLSDNRPAFAFNSDPDTGFYRHTGFDPTKV